MSTIEAWRDLTEQQQQLEVSEKVSYNAAREAQARIEAAPPCELMVPTVYLTHHHLQEYIAHMQKGAEEFLRVLQQTRYVFSFFRDDAKERASGAGEGRQQAQGRTKSCVSPTDPRAQSRSHLEPGVDLEIKHNPLNENGGNGAAGKEEVIVHVKDEDQELVLMKEGYMGEQQKQVVVEDDEQEKGKRVDPESSSRPLQQHSPAQRHWRQREMVVVVEKNGPDVEEQKAMVEEQEEKGEGQQPVVIRQEQKDMGKPAQAQAPPLPLPAPAPPPPPQQEHAQEQQQQSESPPPPLSQQQRQQQQQQPQQLPAKAPPSPWPPSTLQELPASLGALIARSDPFVSWCGVKDVEGEHGDED